MAEIPLVEDSKPNRAMPRRDDKPADMARFAAEIRKHHPIAARRRASRF